jgi:hypothetical protein
LNTANAESQRLADDAARKANWKRWGPYLAERQWGTVREDYSPDGACWDYFSHEQARSRAYRWGEDGLLGITDRECRLCFALALWNGKDPILKERLFGLTNPEGNHGEDVKELYFYLDSTPTHSYMKALYKYPQGEFPYARLVEENRRRGRDEREFEILDTGVFEENRYFDVVAEYAKGAANDILIRITITNHGPAEAQIAVLPTLWFRNTWSWGCKEEDCWIKPRLWKDKDNELLTNHATLEPMRLVAEDGFEKWLFTENETNIEKLFGAPNAGGYTKDAFHEYVVDGENDAVNPKPQGTKAAALYRFAIEPGGKREIRLRLFLDSTKIDQPLGEDFEVIFAQRVAEADAYYEQIIPVALSPEQKRVDRQAHGGLLWSKQYYHYVISCWLEGDPLQPPPSERRKHGRNSDWGHLYNRDVISMPDKWEYPWYAAWDLAFHMLPMANVDADFAKEQLILFLREWYMHPSGQLPAYEFNFSDVNPPVHAWACWRVYKMTAPRGKRDRSFLARTFQKLLINFTWWVNRKDVHGKHIFAGGFLGLDNISIFDRSQPLPTGHHLEQADGTAWMAFYCATMLAMALELASEDPAYEDVASKFFEHFVAIADAMNTLGGSGLWDETDGFYYDQLHTGSTAIPLRVRSMVGLVPLFAVEVLDDRVIDRLPGFRKRMQWFLENRKDLARHIAYVVPQTQIAGGMSHGLHLLAIPSRQRLECVLKYLLDENEFFSPHGIRSLSAIHREHPFRLNLGGQQLHVQYVPGEADSQLFGGNSNWRGPIWFPMNYLLIEALERYQFFYGDSLKVECPTGSGRMMTLGEVAQEIGRRLTALFLPGDQGRRPCHGEEPRFIDDPNFRDLILFYEYFHGDTGRGLGASHQTGWTALVSKLLEAESKAKVAAAKGLRPTHVMA